MIKAYIIGAIVLLGLTLFFRYPTGPYIVDVGFTNGSASGKHIVYHMVITTKAGGKANFAMGSVSGYPGAMSTGGRMSAPAHIQGRWVEGWSDDDITSSKPYHAISAEIPEDAEAKIRVMDNYYKNYHRNYGTIEVIVDGPRVRVFYSKSCVDMYDNCNPRRNADPNGWVIRSPDNITDVVVLFDGVGDSSATRFPDSYFSRLEQRLESKKNSANQTTNTQEQ